jgi:hypothetical protein
MTWAGHGARMEEQERCTRFWWEIPKERDNSQDRGVGGRIESEWIFRRLAGGANWIQLAQDRDRWRNLVNAAMNLRVLAPRSLLVGWFVS